MIKSNTIGNLMRCNKVELNTTNSQKKILYEMVIRAGLLHNVVNYKFRQIIFQQLKDKYDSIKNNITYAFLKSIKDKLPSNYNLQKEMKHTRDYINIGSGNANERINKTVETWKSYCKLMNHYEKQKLKGGMMGIPKMPRYNKDPKCNITLPGSFMIRNNCYSIKGKYLEFMLPKDLKKKYNIKKRIRIKLTGNINWLGKQGRAEIILNQKNDKFYLYQSIIKVECKTKKTNRIEQNENSVASIDFGVKRYMSLLCSTKNECLLVDNNKAFEKYESICKKINNYQSILNKVYSDINGHTVFGGTSKRINKLILKRNNIIDNAQNQAVSIIVKKILSEGVKKVVIGNIEGIRKKHTKHTKNKYLNRMINNYWSYGKLKHKLECKCEEYNVTLKYINEAHTSNTCPSCKSKNVKVEDRDFKCNNCGFENDRDIVGAINIMGKENQEWIQTNPSSTVIQV